MQLFYTLFALAIIFGFLRLINYYFKAQWIKRNVTIGSFVGCALLYTLGSYLGNNRKTSAATKAPTSWSKEYTDTVYNVAYQSLPSTISDSLERKRLAWCYVEKLSRAFPDGLKSASADSVQIMSIQFGKECVLEYNSNSSINP